MALTPAQIATLILTNLATGQPGGITALQHREVEDALNEAMLSNTSIVDQSILSNLIVAAGKTIDGRDVSADGTQLDINTPAILLRSLIADIVDNVTSTDTDKPLSANQGKVLKDLIDLLQGSLVPQGSWNADTNTPDITSESTVGHFWIVSDAGNTDLDGITDWAVNDWAVVTASGFVKIDNTDKVLSVHGRTGAVIAVDGDYDAFYLSVTKTTLQTLLSDLGFAVDKKILLEASTTGTTDLVTLENPNGTHTLRLSTDALQWVLANVNASFQIVNSALTQVLFQVDDNGDAELAGDIALADDKKLALSASGTGVTSLLTATNSVGLIAELQTVDDDIVVDASTGRVILRTHGVAEKAQITNDNASYTGVLIQGIATRSASSAYDLSALYAGGGGDIKFKFSGDGNGTCDGAWTGGGADYAEYFEWADGNPDNEDRVGVSVKLVGNKIAIAEDGDTFLGVISGNPSVVGDGDMGWKKKYLTDDFGRKVLEDYKVIDWVEIKTVDEKEKKIPHSYELDKIPEGVIVPEDAVIKDMTGKDGRPVLNPDYSDDFEYIHRQDRPEWDTVGLVGKLRIKNGQALSPCWIKMRDISEAVSEYFVK